MNQKICLITGANSGIGKETARELARTGATVIMVARDARRGEAARTEIVADTGNHQVALLLADLSSQASTRALAAQVTAQYDRLDLLVNNAGGYFATRQESVDGLELTFALNHMGYFLLTNLLLPLLKASAPARIVNVSSDAHRGGRITLTDYNRLTRYSGFKVYGESKLANVLFTYALARRLEGSGVTVNAMHPGFVRTGFGLNNKGIQGRVIGWLARAFALTPQQGAETAIWLATSADVAGVSGQYFVKKRAKKSSAASYNEEDQALLWALSEELIQRRGG
jgi:NAD(P)-dependent dehydrogenase (short-subunit alcohol dehydrogenase family)